MVSNIVARLLRFGVLPSWSRWNSEPFKCFESRFMAGLLKVGMQHLIAWTYHRQLFWSTISKNVQKNLGQWAITIALNGTYRYLKSQCDFGLVSQACNNFLMDMWNSPKLLHHFSRHLKRWYHRSCWPFRSVLAYAFQHASWFEHVAKAQLTGLSLSEV